MQDFEKTNRIDAYHTTIADLEIADNYLDYHRLRVMDPLKFGGNPSNKIKITEEDLEYLVTWYMPEAGKPFTLIGQPVIAFYDSQKLIAIIADLK